MGCRRAKAACSLLAALIQQRRVSSAVPCPLLPAAMGAQIRKSLVPLIAPSAALPRLRCPSAEHRALISSARRTLAARTITNTIPRNAQPPAKASPGESMPAGLSAPAQPSLPAAGKRSLRRPQRGGTSAKTRLCWVGWRERLSWGPWGHP